MTSSSQATTSMTTGSYIAITWMGKIDRHNRKPERPLETPTAFRPWTSEPYKKVNALNTKWGEQKPNTTQEGGLRAKEIGSCEGVAPTRREVRIAATAGSQT